MNIGILGAGPAGLYAAILLKRNFPHCSVRVFEQNPDNATWGFGVVFSESALTFLRSDDPETADLIEPHMETWNEIRVSHPEETVTIDGIGFSAIGRLKLLQLLQQRAADFGVFPRFRQKLEDLSAFDDCDLVIGADGLNSLVRASEQDQFSETISIVPNWFCWYGSDRPFQALTQTFKATRYGCFNAHHYRFAKDRSTFIVECDEAAFRLAGFSGMRESEHRALCEKIFADTLDGGKLIVNRSVWRQFPHLVNRRWHSGNRVLVGDALHTMHYSIGSGTRLALEDAIALVKALREEALDVSKALPRYEKQRRPALDKFARAALSSAKWYDRFADRMALAPWEFALSYMMRSGRMPADRLRAMSPKFAAGLDRRGIRIDED